MARKQFKRLKFLLVTNLCLTIILTTALLIINSNRPTLHSLSIILYLIIAFGPNLMHIYVSNSLLKNYYPDKEVPRAFIISFRIVSVFGWIVCVALLILTAFMVASYFRAINDGVHYHSIVLPSLIIYVLLVCIIPLQLLMSNKLLSAIQNNHKQNLLETFD